MHDNRQLYLLRHATAQPENPYKMDFNRCLTAQGKKELSEVKLYLTQHKEIKPEIILCSKAKRCKQTLRAVQPFFTHSHIILHHFLYLSSVYTILEILRFIGDNYDNVLIIGHNKTFIEMINFLIQDKQKRDKMFPKGCTCGTLIGLVFEDTKRWQDLPFHEPKLQNIFYP